jgi:hypothetical protein
VILTKIKIIADLTYIPFGAVLLFAPVNILIRAIILFSIIPSAVVGLKDSQKNDVWKYLYSILNYFLQPVMRIEFAVIGIVSTLILDTTTWFLVLAINVVLLPLFVWILKIWMDATFRATWEENGKTSLFRKRAS